jgi:hypothetical protein
MFRHLCGRSDRCLVTLADLEVEAGFVEQAEGSRDEDRAHE